MLLALLSRMVVSSRTVSAMGTSMAFSERFLAVTMTSSITLVPCALASPASPASPAVPEVASIVATMTAPKRVNSGAFSLIVFPFAGSRPDYRTLHRY